MVNLADAQQVSEGTNALVRLRNIIDALATDSESVSIPFVEQQGAVGELARSLIKVQRSLDTCRQGLLASEVQNQIVRALPSDVESVVQLMVEGATDRRFDASLLTETRRNEVTSLLDLLLRSGLAQRVTLQGTTEVTPQELWVYRDSGRAVGFALVQGMNDKGSPDRELHALAVQPEYRGKGIGSAFLQMFCRQFSGRNLYLQCKPDSLMIQMATKNGFVQFGKRGIDVMLWRPAS